MKNDIRQSKIKFLKSISGNHGHIHDTSWSPNCEKIAVGYSGGVFQVWNINTGKVEIEVNIDIEMEGQCDPEYKLRGIKWSRDGEYIAVSIDNKIYIYNSTNGDFINVLKGHLKWINDIAWSYNGEILVSGGADGVVNLWDIRTWTQIASIKLGSIICQIILCKDNKRLFYRLNNNKIGLLDFTTDYRNSIFQDKTHNFQYIDLHPNEEILAIGTSNSIIIYSLKENKKLILEGHTGIVSSLSFSSNGLLLASKSMDDEVYIWNSETWNIAYKIKEKHGHAVPTSICFSPNSNNLATLGNEESIVRIWEVNYEKLINASVISQSIEYVNVKIVLVGESGVGKSGLGIRIAEKEFRPTESTHGAQFWQISLGDFSIKSKNMLVELTLWDLAGQSDYHLIHQLFLDDTDVALLLFDCSNIANPFNGVAYWSKVLKKHLGTHAVKYLIASRCDVSPVNVDNKTINDTLSQYNLDYYFQTCAKTGEGIDLLMQEIIGNIKWGNLTRTKTPLLFNFIREYILERKEAGFTLESIKSINDYIKSMYKTNKSMQKEVNAVINLLQSRGLIYQLKPTPNIALVLFRPELINQYASSIIQAARNHIKGLGTVTERDVICANIPFTGIERLEPEEEKIVLESTIELLIQHDLCFRELGMLVFPSQLNNVRPELVDHPPIEVTYSFSGSVESIYASLVVRLGYTEYFVRENQWKYAVEFSRNSSKLGFTMKQVNEGTAVLEIYFYAGVNDFDKVTFIRFITEHLSLKGIEIDEHIRLYCPLCGREVVNRNAIESRIISGKLDIVCQYCDYTVIIPKSIEELYYNDSLYIKKQDELRKTADERTKEEVKSFKEDCIKFTRGDDTLIHILHLSDIHIRSISDARMYRMQLETDLKVEQGISSLEYLVISGDIANQSTEVEYAAAFEFIDGIAKKFGLDSNRIVVVPGNHDINWDLSEESFVFVPKL